MTVWTLTYSWIEIEKDTPGMDTIILGIYATKELAKKDMEKDAKDFNDHPSFHMEDDFASVDIGDRHYMWEVEDWEVQDENTDS